MALRRLQVLLAAGVALGAALFISNPGPSEADSGLKNLKDRRPAPDFLLKDARGTQVKLSDYKGKVVLLNFWATWCGPCKAEIPWFVEFENKYKGSGFAVLGVSMDDDGWKSVRPFVQQRLMNYSVALGDDALAAAFGGIDSLPQTFLLDREGRIAAKYVGLSSKSHYEDGIVELLGK
jgi:peroxiredoxin